MGRLHLVLLEDGDVYSCKCCHTQLALNVDVCSKHFQCRHGKAYLFTKVVNVFVGKKEKRLMTTGMHTVADIFCVCCGSILGWKYEAAHAKKEKYKEGMFILERFHVLGPDGSNDCEREETPDDEDDEDDADATEAGDSLSLL
ncbi:unnamed protein product [Spirodela intermedia]|uniref:Protein yippee-like n=2 Tax=Spirodela intermedia TaxID=51605 RepID=A0A7I8IAX7_SPIIN|nr:unnamed protein product [Spirodela intermedia]CAA6654907.1 unnamed protein product [Spirodela intermedia]CAA7389617.1 unnamed protein product [Spirodela intermedia]